VPTGKPADESSANLSRFERLVTRWTVVQGIIALLACLVATVAMVATWKQALHNSEQIEQNNTLLRARLYSESVSRSTDIYKILIEKPKLRKYFYAGQDIDEKHPDYPEFAGLADFVLDVFDMTLLFMEIKDSHGRPAWPDPVGWRNWMGDLISTSPGLRRYFAASKDTYVDNPRLLALFQEGGQTTRQRAQPKR
jgi:hypothetical protein